MVKNNKNLRYQGDIPDWMHLENMSKLSDIELQQRLSELVEERPDIMGAGYGGDIGQRNIQFVYRPGGYTSDTSKPEQQTNVGIADREFEMRQEEESFAIKNYFKQRHRRLTNQWANEDLKLYHKAKADPDNSEFYKNQRTALKEEYNYNIQLERMEEQEKIQNFKMNWARSKRVFDALDEAAKRGEIEVQSRHGDYMSELDRAKMQAMKWAYPTLVNREKSLRQEEARITEVVNRIKEMEAAGIDPMIIKSFAIRNKIPYTEMSPMDKAIAKLMGSKTQATPEITSKITKPGLPEHPADRGLIEKFKERTKDIDTSQWRGFSHPQKPLKKQSKTKELKSIYDELLKTFPELVGYWNKLDSEDKQEVYRSLQKGEKSIEDILKDLQTIFGKTK